MLLRFNPAGADCPEDRQGERLGTHPLSGNFWPYARAQEFVRALELRSSREFRNWVAGKFIAGLPRPPEVPSNPQQVYLGEWRGFSDWLGTNRVANFKRNFLPYDEARPFAALLGLKTDRQWRAYCAGKMPGLVQRPANIPSNPNLVYRHSGWGGVKHWLGVGEPSLTGFSRMRSFEEARAFARSLNLSGQFAWQQYAAGAIPGLTPRPADVPSNPNACYKGAGWSGYGDFLGTGRVANHRKIMKPFLEARVLARSLGFRTYAEWCAWARTRARPVDIPANPEKTYSATWRGWRDWLQVCDPSSFASFDGVQDDTALTTGVRSTRKYQPL